LFFDESSEQDATNQENKEDGENEDEGKKEEEASSSSSSPIEKGIKDEEEAILLLATSMVNILSKMNGSEEEAVTIVLCEETPFSPFTDASSFSINICPTSESAKFDLAKAD